MASYPKGKDGSHQIRNFYPGNIYPNIYPTIYQDNRVDGGFGGILDGKLIVGNNLSVYQYNVDKDAWIEIDKNSSKSYFDSHRVESRSGAKGCEIGDRYLVYGDRAELLAFKPWLTTIYKSFSTSREEDSDDASSEDENIGAHEEENRGSSLVNDNKPPNQQPLWKKIAENCWSYLEKGSNPQIRRKPPIRMLRNQFFCHTPVRVSGHSMTNVGPDKVLLIGGYQDYGKTSPLQHIFLGQLTWDKWNVKWKKLDRMNTYRYGHMAFKMKEHVYVVGGMGINKIEENRILSSCERYNLNENTWSFCEYSLPYPLYDASVVVSTDETFAIISGGSSKKYKCTNKIIIFEEDKGFKLLKDKMLRQRSNHVSIRIL